MNACESILSEHTNTCESVLSETANTCELVLATTCTCELALSDPITVSNSSVSSVNTGPHDVDGSPSVHVAIGGGSEPPSPVSSSVDEFQTLPVVEAAHVSEIAEQQRRDSELNPILKYLDDGTIPPEKKLARDGTFSI